MKHELDATRYEINIMAAFALGLFTTSAVYNYSLWKSTKITQASFMGSEIFAGYMTSPSNWFFFCVGILICLSIYAASRIDKYTEVDAEE